MQIAQGIYSMGQEEGGHVHAFLLDDGNGLTLLDTIYDDDGKRVLGRDIPDWPDAGGPEDIILTHAHKSHLGGLAALKKASGATVCWRMTGRWTSSPARREADARQPDSEKAAAR